MELTGTTLTLRFTTWWGYELNLTVDLLPPAKEGEQ